jgi:hypothetical protein
MAAAVDILDKYYNPLPSRPHDDNNYTFDRIKNYNVIIICLSFGITDITSTANIARNIIYTFDRVRKSNNKERPNKKSIRKRIARAIF